jgi:hypothetical protein
MLVILAIWEAETGRIAIQGQPGHIVHEPISKITRAEWTGDVAQAIEYLFYQWETLSANLSPTNLKKVPCHDTVKLYIFL